MTTIAVAGGTGVVGRLVVEEVRRRGDTARVISRSEGVDLTTGAGLAEALDGADAVIDASNVATLRAKPAIEWFETAGRHLLGAGERAGVRHHVALSIVGCDRVDLGYYLGKRAQERAVTEGPVPWTIVRATQFHEFPGQLLDRAPGPVALAFRMRSQPIAAREVAAVLVDAALAEPAGLLPDVAGPEELAMHDLVRRVARHRGLRKLVVPTPVPGRAGRQIKDGGLLPTGDATLGTETFDAWLDRAPRG